MENIQKTQYEADKWKNFTQSKMQSHQNIWSGKQMKD